MRVHAIAVSRAIGLTMLASCVVPRTAAAAAPTTPEDKLKQSIKLQMARPSAHDAVIRRPFEQFSADISWGYDSRTGEFKLPCLSYGAVRAEPARQPASQSDPGVITSQLFEGIDSYQSASSKLNLDMTATMRYFSGSGGASTSVADDMQVSQFTTTALLRLYLQRAATTSTSFAPKSADITKLARNKQGFRARCGDSFVYSVVRGGEFVAMVTATGSNSQTLHSVRAAFNASYNAFAAGGGISAALSEIKKSSSSISKITMKAWTAGAQGEYVTQEKLQSLAEGFFAKATTNPVIVELRTMSYDQVDGLFNDDYDDNLTTIGYCALELNEHIGALRYMHDNPTQFVSIKAADVDSELDKARKTLTYVQQQISNNTTKWAHTCPTLPPLPDLTGTADINITTCGWNSVVLLPSNIAGWSIKRLGTWCAWNDAKTCSGSFFVPGQNDNLRCSEGNLTISGDATNVAGPCHLESIIGDNICNDNTTPDGNHFRIEYSGNLPKVDWDRFVADLKVQH